MQGGGPHFHIICLTDQLSRASFTTTPHHRHSSCDWHSHTYNRTTYRPRTQGWRLLMLAVRATNLFAHCSSAIIIATLNFHTTPRQLSSPAQPSSFRSTAQNNISFILFGTTVSLVPLGELDPTTCPRPATQRLSGGRRLHGRGGRVRSSDWGRPSL
ncbi:hypothetical protein J6590_051779 [Homalodisca vitripennis]|nr:hypothetical protein J6590_051779 [Homalodisca vitripennis]